MAKLNLGFCAASIRFLIILLNSLLLTCGLVVFITAAVLKWTTFLNKFLTTPNIDLVIKTGSISSISTSLLIISGFVCLVSLIGLIGAKYSNKLFLIIYEVIIILLFLAHGISILVLVFSSSSIEKQFKSSFNSTIDDLITDAFKNSTDFDQKCNLTFAVSKIFKCCGYNGPSDFKETGLAEKCCDQSSKETSGCGQKVVDDIKKHAVTLLVVPSVIILCIELLGMIMIPFLIGRIK